MRRQFTHVKKKIGAFIGAEELLDFFHGDGGEETVLISYL